MEKKRSFKDWLLATRPWSFPASAMPVMATWAYLAWSGEHPDMINGVWALINIILFHAAGNTWSDYADYMTGVDAADTFGARTITDGIFRPSEIKRLAIGLFLVAISAGLLLTLRTGLPLLAIGAIGFLGAVGYPLLKYNAWGDVCIFFTYALIPMVGTIYVTTNRLNFSTLWAIVPIGLITVAILHANNSRDVVTDKRAKIKTLAMLAGERMSMILYWLEVILPFILIALYVTLGCLPAWTLLVLAALIPAAANVRRMSRLENEGGTAIVGLDEATAKLQLVFGLLFTVSLLIAAWTA